MKKIMKKALSLALALVMMLSLAPMTAMAASGTGTTSDPYVIADSEVDGETTFTASIPDGAYVYYKYVIEEDGIFTVTVTDYDLMGFTVEMFDMAPSLYATQLGSLNSWENVITDTIAVNAGDEVWLQVSTLEADGNTYDVGFTVEYEAGGTIPGSSASSPAALDDGYAVVGEKKYFAIDAEAGKEYTLTVQYIRGDGLCYNFYLVNGESESRVQVSQNEETGLVDDYEVTITPTTDKVVFAIEDANYMYSYTSTICATLVEVGQTPTPTPTPSTNSASNPELIEGDVTESYTVSSVASHWFKWTADKAGVVTLSTTSEGATLTVETVNGSYDGFVYKAVSDSTTEVEVIAGDVVLFYTYPASGETEIALEIETEAGAKIENDELIEEDADYEVSTTPLTEGEKTYALGNVPYTVFEFAPTATGVYTITVVTEDTVMGNLGAQRLASMLNDSVVKETTITIECKEVGQTWNIAVAGATNEAIIKVTKTGEAEQGLGYDRYTAYVGLISPEAYTYEGKVEDLKVVNHKDDVIDKAVMGADSYYHLNSVDGPIIFVDLDDSKVISLYDVFVNGGMKAVYYKSDNTPDYVVDYSLAFNFYYETLADKETKLYPLTADLMEMIQEVGNTKGNDWFDKTNQYGVKSDKEDAWMFCCYYNEDITTDEAPYTIPPFYANSLVEDYEKPVVDKEAMEILVELNKTQPVSVIAFTGDDDEIVTFTFAPTTLKLVDGVEKYDFSVELVKDADKVENDKVTKDNFVLRINFAYSGKLPAEATIAIPVPEAIAEKYEVLYYYQIMEDGSLKYVCDAPVEGGIATVKQDHCSDYVLLTEKLPEDTTTDDAKAPKTGDSSNIALWVAVLGLGVVAIAGSVVMKKREF